MVDTQGVCARNDRDIYNVIVNVVFTPCEGHERMRACDISLLLFVREKYLRPPSMYHSKIGLRHKSCLDSSRTFLAPSLATSKLQERDQTISLMQVTESALRVSIDGKEARVSDLEAGARELQGKLDAADATRKALDARLAQELKSGESARKELADRASLEQVCCSSVWLNGP